MINRSEDQLEMVFRGPDVDEGQMNVRDLAPSMLALGALYEAANRILNGSRTEININVKATSSSSFHVIFGINQLTTQQLLNVSDLLTNAVALQMLIFGSGAASLFGLIKLLSGKKPEIKKLNQSLYSVTIDNQTYEIPLELFKLYQDVQTRRSLEDLVKPVKRTGINEFQIRDGRQRPLQIITKNEVNAFDIPTVRELISENKSTKAFKIDTLIFEGKKWKLNDGNSSIWVTLKDETFQSQINQNVDAFAKDDLLICEINTIQWQVQDKIETEVEVLKIIDHKQARQLPLIHLPEDKEETK